MKNLPGLEQIKDRFRKDDLDRFARLASDRWNLRRIRPVLGEIKNILTIGEGIKNDIKSGRNTAAQQETVKQLAQYIFASDIRQAFYQCVPGAFYQIISALSEQFFRWGDVENAKKCVESADDPDLDGKALLKEIRTYIHSPGKAAVILDGESRITKELIRFCLAYIQIGIHKGDVLNELKNCQKFVDKKLELDKKQINKPDQEQNKDSWYGTQALIQGHLGRCYRNRIQYDLAIQSFGKSLDFYEKRLLARGKRIHRGTFLEKASVQNKMALTLILGYAWMDIQRGQFSKGLYNSLAPARTLLAGMEDTLAQNYLELLEVTAQRGLAMPTYVSDANRLVPEQFHINEVLEKARLVCDKFEELRIPRFLIRAKYELAMCLLFAGKWDQVAEVIHGESNGDESADVPEKQLDKFWAIKWSLLKARFQARKKRYGGSDRDLTSVIAELEDLESGVKDYKQVELDYYLTIGEVYLSSGDYKNSQRSFNMVIKQNKGESAGPNVESLNPRSEARALLELCRIYLRTGRVSSAENVVSHWDQVLSKRTDDVYLHNLAEINRKELSVIQGRVLIIRIESTDDINYELQEKKLRKFLIDQAHVEADSVEAISGYLGIKRSTYYNWINQINAQR